MDFPITVTALAWEGDSNPIDPWWMGYEIGSWVAVRPVKDDKTYLGILLGNYAPPKASFNKETGILTVGKSAGNPAMWVPDLKRVIMGWGSWWWGIKTEADLRQISDQDIDNVWYVKALKSLAEDAKKPAEPNDPSEN